MSRLNDFPDHMSDDEIRDYYDTRPNMTLRELARMTGRSVKELKKILMGG